MKARDRAIRIVCAVMGGGYTLACFEAMLRDQSEPGALLRKMVDAVEQGIEEDRRQCEKARAPS